MALIRIENGKLSFGTKELFKDVSFSIDNNDKIGLVGNNGCGKSSLIKALIGELPLDKGKVTKKKSIQIGYVSQEVPKELEEKACYDFLYESIPEQMRDEEFWKVDVALSELELPEEFWQKPISSLSGGWRRLLLIASATLKSPDVMILDEPTNHLDLGKIFKLESWLKSGLGLPYLIISHDRELLDKCTSKTLFMRDDGVHEFAASFSVARDNLIQADTLAMKSFQTEQVKIQQLERAAKRLKDWGQRAPKSDLGKKGAVMQNRAEDLKSKQTIVYQEKKREIKLYEDGISSKAVAIIQDLDICSPDNRKLFHIDKLVVRQGDRICLMGLNGAGKSMFIKHLVNELNNYVPGASARKKTFFSPQVHLGYLDQHLKHLPNDKNLYTYLSEAFSLNRTETIRELANIGFPVDQQSIKIGKMSSGERARVSLLSLKLLKPNFYILDEPTNHLDIQGQEDLEEELDSKEHTCIFVSHDRTLVRGASTRYLEIYNKKLIEVESPEPFFERLIEQSLASNE